jgi:AcrR family transcriptional regulator
MTATDKRKTILRALEKVLKDRRFDEVTVDEVADEAGVGKGTVYRHFQDKENLFFEMVRNFLVEEENSVMVAAASSLQPREKLIRVGEEMSRHIQKHSEYVRMMHRVPFSAANSKPSHDIMDEHHQRLDRILAQLLRDAEESGLMRAGLDCDTIICAYKGMVLSRSMRLLHGGSDIPVARLVDLLLTGIGQEG